jgi:hypothetical protein
MECPKAVSNFQQVRQADSSSLGTRNVHSPHLLPILEASSKYKTRDAK